MLLGPNGTKSSHVVHSYFSGPFPPFQFPPFKNLSLSFSLFSFPSLTICSPYKVVLTSLLHHHATMRRRPRRRFRQPQHQLHSHHCYRNKAQHKLRFRNNYMDNHNHNHNHHNHHHHEHRFILLQAPRALPRPMLGRNQKSQIQKRHPQPRRLPLRPPPWQRRHRERVPRGAQGGWWWWW